LANEDLEEWCRPGASELDSIGNPSSVFSAGDARSNFQPALPPSSRIRSFGILPFSVDVPTSELVSCLEKIATSSFLKGAIIGSRGRGKGLDDPDLDPVWACAERLNQPLFLHPHYGVGSDSINEDGLFGTRENGHVLPLALGFPFETASVCERPWSANVMVRSSLSPSPLLPVSSPLVANIGSCATHLVRRIRSLPISQDHPCSLRWCSTRLVFSLVVLHLARSPRCFSPATRRSVLHG
jgi:aminocarboxymuconate-semialdehyde decarboxylase